MRRRLRALLPRLHVLPALSKTVVDVEGRAIAAALQEAGPDGDVFVVDASADELERIRAGCSAPNVFFLIGTPEVLPLPDRSVDVVLGDVDEAERTRVVR